MTDYWPWWLSGLALSTVMLFHWFTLHRMMAVSGRVSALIDRLRFGPPPKAPSLSPEDMLAAIQAATAEEFGTDALGSDGLDSDGPGSDALPSASSENVATSLNTPPPRTSGQHFLFLAGLICGGTLAALLGSGFAPTLSLNGPGFTELTSGETSTSVLFLAAGGVLVGFGTRMSGGCTSGHGLCGSSRMQPGSLVATLSFFGVGILISFALQALL